MQRGREASGKARGGKPEKETIHSGHFMVSDFEAEAQDDEFNVAVALPDEESKLLVVAPSQISTPKEKTQQVSIETSLTKLFQCMSLAYRQKLTSPKWNRFKGIRLRWKDKIRLNNVIWRCWHMQFIMKQNTLVCQFASPLDVDTHNKPEAVVLEGKYWKRKLAAVTAEYKKWRMFYRNRIVGWSAKDGSPEMLTDMDVFDWQPRSNDSMHSVGSMMMDEDYMEFMSDTLFSTIQSNQPFAFPDTREIARGASLADFIQPSLVQLQPNLDDFMDTFEPLQELLSYSKLPSVPEENIMPAADESVLFSEPMPAQMANPSLGVVQSAAAPPTQSQRQHLTVQVQVQRASELEAAHERLNRSEALTGGDLFAVPEDNRAKSRPRSHSGPLDSFPVMQPLLAQLLTTNTQTSPAVFNFTGVPEVGQNMVKVILPPSPSQTVIAGGTSPPLGSPSSPPKGRRRDGSGPPKEHRRMCHINAEQKRRCNIKNGFDMLHSLIPQLQQNPNAKLSKAAMLQKGAEYIRQLRAERDQLREEMLALRHEIELLNSSISSCQALLPATGAPVSRRRSDKMREMYEQYVRARTLDNWKFWIFSMLLEPLLTSYSGAVSTASADELFRSTLLWVEQHCSLVDLRPAVLNSLRYLCTATDILANPERLPHEARAAVLRK